jgi:hypothetical protein
MQGLVGKPERKRPLGRPRRRRENNIKMILEKYNVMVWARLIWRKVEALMNTVKNFRVPKHFGKFLRKWEHTVA